MKFLLSRNDILVLYKKKLFYFVFKKESILIILKKALPIVFQKKRYFNCFVIDTLLQKLSNNDIVYTIISLL